MTFCINRYTHNWWFVYDGLVLLVLFICIIIAMNQTPTIEEYVLEIHTLLGNFFHSQLL